MQESEIIYPSPVGLNPFYFGQPIKYLYMEINKIQFNKDINILTISDIGIYVWRDTILLKNIFRKLFSENDTIFFSFRREENLISVNELEKLRNSIISTINNHGEYVVLKQIDEMRFDSVAKITIMENTYDFLIEILRYFYSCSFFIANEGFSFSDFIAFQKNNKFHDRLSEKLLTNCYSDFVIIKGLGGDHIILTYRNNINLPDINNVTINDPFQPEMPVL